jgi:XTP/dITP diphosphohydrolase
MMKKFIIASKNKGKLLEFKKILHNLSDHIISMEEAGILEEIEETGSTFEENSMIKARSVFQVTGGIVVSDDSGLEIDALDGAPGVFSARFAGEKASNEDRIQKVLELLTGVPEEKRVARFVCSISVIFDENTFFQTKGVCEGRISLRPEGVNGFGYDPIFYLPQYKKTMAEISSEVKNTISHRAKAVDLMKLELKKYFK